MSFLYVASQSFFNVFKSDSGFTTDVSYLAAMPVSVITLADVFDVCLNIECPIYDMAALVLARKFMKRGYRTLLSDIVYTRALHLAIDS